MQSARRMALVQAETDARLQTRLSRVPLTVAVNSDPGHLVQEVVRDVATRGEVALRIRIEDEARTLAMP